MNKLTGKDLITVGIYTAIYFVVLTAVAMLGFIPVFLVLLAVLVPIVCGIPMMLYYSKIEKFGMLTITGIICGLLMMLTGMGFYIVITGFIIPLAADFILLTMAFFVLGQSGHNAAGYYVHILAAVPLILLLSAKMWKNAITYVILYGGSLAACEFLLPHINGGWHFCLVAVCGILMRFVPGIMMGYIMVKTTTVSEFISAMERMHMPETITIPMSVMFRFFPTVLEEAQSVNKAMRMRDIRPAGRRASDMLEYRLVPIIMCSVKIGEELSAAALSRGLGGKVKRTNICKIGFHLQDFFCFVLCAGVFACSVIIKFM